ncbi:hypothetical protein BKA70DRAFT_1309011 [Coprinopsis sp. MPI-PUGE-AT-0042]|nr:hypothetical protein BKA70DRAFT_1309011 [Coprinopsis sp. MPI-PUGE-AT-0042]
MGSARMKTDQKREEVLKTKDNGGRRRSFHRILARPTSYYGGPGEVRAGPSSPIQKPSTLILNADVLGEITEYLSASDTLSLCLCSSQLYSTLLPCSRTLRSNRHLCGYIRKLAVRPNYYLSWPQQDQYLDEQWVAMQLVDLCGDLSLLTTFDWDALELPDDRLWEALRIGCPSLKSVFANVGTRPINPESNLFSFSNLTSFSLIVRHGLGGSVHFPTPEELPPHFWDMILERCPDLEELAICSFSSAWPEGRWPSLNSINLGPFGYSSDWSLGPASLVNSEDGRLGEFFEFHSKLKYIRFLWNFSKWMSPESIPFAHKLQKTALPNVDTYIGVYQQLLEMPKQTLSKIKTGRPYFRLGDVCRALRRMKSLTSLDLWIHMAARPHADHSAFFRAIVKSCPKLTDLHLMCTTSLTVLLVQLAELPNLKRFSLTKGHTYLADDNMLNTATRIVKALPQLSQVKIRWARESCPNHLKQEGIYEVMHSTDSLRPTIEDGVNVFGTPFRRRYIHTLALSTSTLPSKPVPQHPSRRWSANSQEWHRSVARTSRMVGRRMSSVLS